MSARELITEHLDLWTGAVTKKSSSGRGSNGKVELTGIKKLRELILELAVRGKLVDQIPSDEPANNLLERIDKDKDDLTKRGKLKKTKKYPPVSQEDYPFRIPRLWAWERMHRVFLKITDGTHHSPSNNENGDFPYVSAKNIKPEGVLLKGITYVTRDVHQEIFSRCNPEPGDLLYIKDGATTGITAINDLDEPFSMLSSVALLKPHHQLFSNKFLLYCLRAPFFYQEMRAGMTGVAITRVTLKKLDLALVPIPPINEQHRIVQKVDELMALCDRLEQQTSDQLEAHETLVDTLLGTLTQSENATELADNWARLAAHFDTLFTTEQSIDKLKQTVLQLAVMGRLVEQDSGDEPATGLLKRIESEKRRLTQGIKKRAAKPLPPIEESERPFSLPSGWTLSRLDDITDIQGGIAKGKKVVGKKTRTLPYLRVANVQRSSLNLSEVKEIEIADEEVERYLVQQRDLLITEGGDWDKVGRTAIWDGCIKPMAHQNHVFRARLILDEQSERWLERYLNSQFARDYFASSSKQTTNLASINKTQLRSCTIPLPPLKEQDRIVQKVDELMALCDQLKERLNQASETRCQLAEAAVDKAMN